MIRDGDKTFFKFESSFIECVDPEFIRVVEPFGDWRVEPQFSIRSLLESIGMFG